MNCEEYVVSLLQDANKQVSELQCVIDKKNAEIVKLKGQLDELQSIITMRGKKNIFYSTGTQEIEITISNRGYDKVESDLFDYLNSEFPDLPIHEYGKPETSEVTE